MDREAEVENANTKTQNIKIKMINIRENMASTTTIADINIHTSGINEIKMHINAVVRKARKAQSQSQAKRRRKKKRRRKRPEKRGNRKKKTRKRIAW